MKVGSNKRHSKYLIQIFILLISFELISNYKLYDESEYSFKAIYHSDQENENIPLIYKLPGEITKMIIDNEEVEPCTSYTFAKPGLHTIYALIDISSTTSLNMMFRNAKNLDSMFSLQNSI